MLRNSFCALPHYPACLRFSIAPIPGSDHLHTTLAFIIGSYYYSEPPAICDLRMLAFELTIITFFSLLMKP